MSYELQYVEIHDLHVNHFRYWLSVGARPSKPVAILLGLVSSQKLDYLSSSL